MNSSTFYQSAFENKTFNLCYLFPYLRLALILPVFLLQGQKAFLQTPGGIAGSVVWYKANAGVTQSGGKVSTWADQSGRSNNATQTTTANRPVYTSNAFNFNSALTFNEADATSMKAGVNSFPTGTNSRSIFFVASYGHSTQENDSWIWGYGPSTDAGAGCGVFSIGKPNGKTSLYVAATSSGCNTQSADAFWDVTSPKLGAITFSGGTANFYDAGLKTHTATPNWNTSTNLAQSQLGVWGTTDRSTNLWNGNIAELIMFSSLVDGTAAAKVESYLAIKYGIHKTGNYLNSEGAVIWNSSANTLYHNDVFGIMRDNSSGLHQYQSNSMNTGSGDGTGLAGKGNILLRVGSSDLGDKDFLLIGHSANGFTFDSPNVPAPYSGTPAKRTGRVWAINKSATFPATTINLDLNLTGLAYGATQSNLKLLIDTDGDGNFSNASVVTPGTVNAQTNVASFSISSTSLPSGAKFAFLITDPVGYVYLHLKALSEDYCPDVSFALNGTTSMNFKLNDKPASDVNIFDVGASHGSGDGQLWAVGGPSTSHVLKAHDVPGFIYMRDKSSNQWKYVSGPSDVYSIDGIGANTAVYCNSVGNVYLLNNPSSTLIWNPSNHGNTKIVDVASGGPGGIIVGVGNNHKLYKYTGNGANDSWASFNCFESTADAWRVDVLPATQTIAVLRYTGDACLLTSNDPATATITNVPRPNSWILSDQADFQTVRDIAYGDNGKLFVSYAYYNGNTSMLVCEYDGTSWQTHPSGEYIGAITGGPGGQVWGSYLRNYNESEPIPIWTKPPTSDGEWLDDERVRTGLIGNSILIPVVAGTYTLSENTTISGWNTTNIRIFDPSNNSTADVKNNSMTLNVGSGEIVNVEYAKSFIIETPIPKVCNEQYVQDFGRGVAGVKKGPALKGFTPYHFGTSAKDGYYEVTQNEWGNNNHTPNDPYGYFVIFNAGYAKDEFYRQVMTDLLPGRYYKLSFWAVNVSYKALRKPNMTMGVANNETGEIISTVNTGEIFGGEWQQFSFIFQANNPKMQIFIKNDGLSGPGNDFGLDDITIEIIPTPLSKITVPEMCSDAPLGTTFEFTNLVKGGTWSSSDPANLPINGTTGMATPKFNATGSARITYTHSDEASCISSVDTLVSFAPCNVLPLTLLSFEVTKTNSANRLQWTTTQEVNTSSFEIERSADGKNFVTLGSVDASNVAGNHSYAFKDNSPLIGKNFYRLKMINLDNSFTYSPVKTVVSNGESTITISPNPVKDVIHVKNAPAGASIRILDMSGRLLKQQFANTADQNINIAGYPSGMYIVQVIRNEEITATIKIVKQ